MSRVGETGRGCCRVGAQRSGNGRSRVIRRCSAGVTGTARGRRAASSATGSAAAETAAETAAGRAAVSAAVGLVAVEMGRRRRQGRRSRRMSRRQWAGGRATAGEGLRRESHRHASRPSVTSMAHTDASCLREVFVCEAKQRGYTNQPTDPAGRMLLPSKTSTDRHTLHGNRHTLQA